MAASALKPFDEDAFREWVERDESRKELVREAAALKAENDLVANELLAALVANKKTSLVRGDFEGEILERKGTVAWKNEFLRLVGADAAAELANKVETHQYAIIRRRTAPAA